MKPDLIPLVWDDGRIGSVAADAKGILRLRHAIDTEMERELAFARAATGLSRLAATGHSAFLIDTSEVILLVDEFEWHRT